MILSDEPGDETAFAAILPALKSAISPGQLITLNHLLPLDRSWYCPAVYWDSADGLLSLVWGGIDGLPRSTATVNDTGTAEWNSQHDDCASVACRRFLAAHYASDPADWGGPRMRAA